MKTAMTFGGPELIIVLIIVILLFGVNRIGKIGKELGQGIREFRKGVTGENETTDEADNVATRNP